MNAKEQLQKVKVLLGLETKLETMKLDNGTVLEADSFEAGKEVFVIADEDKVAVPVGEYTLEDGKILVVSEEGIIGEIKDAESTEEEAPAEEAEETEEVEAETEVVAEETEEEETKEETVYATKEEFEALKALVEKLMPQEEELTEEVVETETETELSEEPKEEVKEEVELSEETEEVKEEEVVELSKEEIESANPIKHNPEVNLSKQTGFKKKPQNTRLSNIYRKFNSK